LCKGAWPPSSSFRLAEETIALFFKPAFVLFFANTANEGRKDSRKLLLLFHRKLSLKTAAFTFVLLRERLLEGMGLRGIVVAGNVKALLDPVESAICIEGDSLEIQTQCAAKRAPAAKSRQLPLDTPHCGRKIYDFCKSLFSMLARKRSRIQQ
jgi:hypothetical protein